MIPTSTANGSVDPPNPLRRRQNKLGVVLLVGLGIFAVLAGAIGWRSPPVATGYFAAEVGEPVHVYLDYTTYPGWRPLVFDDLTPLDQPLDLSTEKDGSLTLAALSSRAFAQNLFRTRWHLELVFLVNKEGPQELGPISLDAGLGRIVFPLNLVFDATTAVSSSVDSGGGNHNQWRLSSEPRTYSFQVRSKDDEHIWVRISDRGVPEGISFEPQPALELPPPHRDGFVEAEVRLLVDREDQTSLFFRPWLEVTSEGGTTELGLGPFINLYWWP